MDNNDIALVFLIAGGVLILTGSVAFLINWFITRIPPLDVGIVPWLLVIIGFVFLVSGIFGIIIEHGKLEHRPDI